jgi:hypothetical protein
MKMIESEIPGPEEISNIEEKPGMGRESMSSHAESREDKEHSVSEGESGSDVREQIEEEPGQEEKESPKIELPEDPEVVQRLQGKLETYKEQLEKAEKAQEAYKAPETAFLDVALEKYRVDVLEELLKKGIVRTFDLARRLKAEGRMFSPSAFQDACSEIERLL